MTWLDRAFVTKIVLSPWVWGLAVFVVWIFVLPIIKRMFFVVVRRQFTGHPALSWIDEMLAALSPALQILIWATGLAMLLRILPLSARLASAIAIGLDAAVALALIVFLDAWARPLLERLVIRSLAIRGEYGLIRGGVRGAIIALGVLIFLDSIGISITPILASLGIGSLAIVLALQDTLNNLFAGIYIAADQPIVPGDFVKLESGQEGYLMRLGWRSSHIRMIPEGAVVVPNQKLATSVLTNYSLPSGEVAITVDLGVSADSDLDHVERIAVEAAREVMRTLGGGASEFEPGLRYLSFAGSAVKFSVFLRCRQPDVAVVRHEFIKRIRARFRQEQIALA